MDKLGLVNFFLVETGINDVVAATADSNDDVVQAAHWVDTSWQSFQRDSFWDFRKGEKTMSVTSGTNRYTLAGLSLSAGDLIIPGSFYASEGNIEQISYEALRARRRSGATTDTTRVTHVAIKDAGIETYPTLTTTQSLQFDYWKTVQVLDADTDVPYGLAPDFHALIAHLAISRYGVIAGGQEGANLYQHHAKEYSKILNEVQIWAGVDRTLTRSSLIQGTFLK